MSDAMPGELWDCPLDQAPLVFVDLEMSGLDPEHDRVLQICAERVVGATLQDRLTSFVRPQSLELVTPSQHIHGIRVQDVQNAPAFAEIAERVLELLAGAVLVAHGAKTDVAFLQAELGRVDRAWRCRHFLDTLSLSRRAFRLQRHSLIALAEAFDISYEVRHRADHDVRVLRGVFRRICERLSPTSARQLWSLSENERHAQPEIIAAAKRAAELRLPAHLLYRPSGRRPQQLDFQVTAVRTDLDPPRVLGYLQQSRGRRELRADRILTFELVNENEPNSAR